jgi:arylsulfatase A-like enzyme
MKASAVRTLIFMLVAPCAGAQPPPSPADWNGALPPEVKPAPNIILIMADDLGYGSLGCYGHPDLKTPNIDALAATGMRFTDFHSNGAMCTPTRAALMTGRYPQRCAWVPDAELTPISREQRGKNLKQRWAWGVSKDELFLPELLGQCGYRSALIGKWHLGYDRKFHPMNHGFDEFRGFIGGAVDYHSHVATHGSKELDWWKNGKIGNEAGYATDLLTRYATEFIGVNRHGPFFLYLAHAAPHEPLQGRQPHQGKSPAKVYQEMIGILDESVGAVIQALRDHGLEKNTLVIFCSDNGPAPPQGFSANGVLKGRKGDMFEGGHRVPFIANWPGVIPGGRTSGDVAMSMDLLPTFARLAGARIPQDHTIDGIDLMPILKGEAKAPSRNLHWLFGDAWAVRKGSWKLMGNGARPQALFHLEDDLSEKNNLIKQRPELADGLFELHRKWIVETGDK